MYIIISQYIPAPSPTKKLKMEEMDVDNRCRSPDLTTSILKNTEDEPSIVNRQEGNFPDFMILYVGINSISQHHIILVPF